MPRAAGRRELRRSPCSHPRARAPWADDAQVVVDDAEQFQYDEEHIEKQNIMGKPGLCQVIQKQDTFVFTVESTGAHRPEDIVDLGLQVLIEKINNLQAHLQSEMQEHMDNFYG